MSASSLFFLLFSIEYQPLLNSSDNVQPKQIFSLPSALQVITRHYEPFMYMNREGKFASGIEFRLMETIAKKLKTNLCYANNNNAKSDVLR